MIKIELTWLLWLSTCRLFAQTFVLFQSLTSVLVLSAVNQQLVDVNVKMTRVCIAQCSICSAEWPLLVTRSISPPGVDLTKFTGIFRISCLWLQTRTFHVNLLSPQTGKHVCRLFGQMLCAVNQCYMEFLSICTTVWSEHRLFYIPNI